MLTMTLTEFNQNPSRATRLAEHGEVGILRRGVLAFKLVPVDPPEDPLASLVTAGLARPPRRHAGPKVFRTLNRPDIDVDAELAPGRTLDGLG